MRNHFISKHRKWLIYGGLFFFPALAVEWTRC